jgi:hypothetical protein
MSTENLRFFFISVVQDQLKELEEEGQLTYEQLKTYCDNFYETCIKYIQEQCFPFLAPIQGMDWITLKKVPNWNCVSE